MDLNSSGARLFQNNLIGMLLLQRTGIELTSIVSRATMLPLSQRCCSIPIWKEEKSRLLNSFVTGISAIFCQRYRFCVVRESNPCQELEKLLCYHFINDASQLLREKKKDAGFTTHLYQILMKKILLSLNFGDRVRVTLHRTGIEPFSIDCKVSIQALHKRCSSTQTWTVENILDLNTSEARFSWKILIRLGLLRQAGIKLMSIAWRCAGLPLHQWCSSITTLEKENIRVV